MEELRPCYLYSQAGGRVTAFCYCGTAREWPLPDESVPQAGRSHMCAPAPAAAAPPRCTTRHA
eukprot:366546-Chlamydomonas_euryale.AAC.1